MSGPKWLFVYLWKMAEGLWVNSIAKLEPFFNHYNHFLTKKSTSGSLRQTLVFVMDVMGEKMTVLSQNTRSRSSSPSKTHPSILGNTITCTSNTSVYVHGNFCKPEQVQYFQFFIFRSFKWIQIRLICCYQMNCNSNYINCHAIWISFQSNLTVNVE